MLRLLRRFATAGLLLAVILALWVRSYWRYDAVEGWSFGLASYRGDLALAFIERAEGGEGERPVRYHSGPAVEPGAEDDWTYLRDNAVWRVAGVSYTMMVEGKGPVRILIVPDVVFVLPAVVWAAVVLGRRGRRGRKRRLGLCPVCGYDLRATPGRCPECGAGIVASSDTRSA